MASLASQSLARSIMSSPLAERESTKRIRFAAGIRNQYGEYVAGARTETDIDTVTVPMTGQEVQSLPEGLRSENVRKFYTETEIRGVKECDDPSLADRIEFDGSEWRVDIVHDWGGFYEVICSEIRS